MAAEPEYILCDLSTLILMYVVDLSLALNSAQISQWYGAKWLRLQSALIDGAKSEALALKPFLNEKGKQSYLLLRICTGDGRYRPIRNLRAQTGHTAGVKFIPKGKWKLPSYSKDEVQPIKITKKAKLLDFDTQSELQQQEVARAGKQLFKVYGKRALQSVSQVMKILWPQDQQQQQQLLLLIDLAAEQQHQISFEADKQLDILAGQQQDAPGAPHESHRVQQELENTAVPDNPHVQAEDLYRWICEEFLADGETVSGVDSDTDEDAAEHSGTQNGDPEPSNADDLPSLMEIDDTIGLQAGTSAQPNHGSPSRQGQHSPRTLRQTTAHAAGSAYGTPSSSCQPDQPPATVPHTFGGVGSDFCRALAGSPEAQRESQASGSQPPQVELQITETAAGMQTAADIPLDFEVRSASLQDTVAHILSHAGVAPENIPRTRDALIRVYKDKILDVISGCVIALVNSNSRLEGLEIARALQQEIGVHATRSPVLLRVGKCHTELDASGNMTREWRDVVDVPKPSGISISGSVLRFGMQGLPTGTHFCVVAPTRRVLATRRLGEDFIETELPVEALTAGGPLTIEIDGPLIRPLLIDLPESAVSQIARVLRASWDQPPTISSMEQLDPGLFCLMSGIEAASSSLQPPFAGPSTAMARHWIRQEYELLNLVAKEFLEGLRHDGLPIGDARSVHEQLRDKMNSLYRERAAEQNLRDRSSAFRRWYNVCSRRIPEKALIEFPSILQDLKHLAEEYKVLTSSLWRIQNKDKGKQEQPPAAPVPGPSGGGHIMVTVTKRRKVSDGQLVGAAHASGRDLREAMQGLALAMGQQGCLDPLDLAEFHFEDMDNGTNEAEQDAVHKEVHSITISFISKPDLDADRQLQREMRDVFVASFQHLDAKLQRVVRDRAELAAAFEYEVKDEHSFLAAHGSTGKLLAFVVWKDLAQLQRFEGEQGIHISQMAVAHTYEGRCVMAKLLTCLRLSHPHHWLGGLVPAYNTDAARFWLKLGALPWDDAVLEKVNREEYYDLGRDAVLTDYVYSGFKVLPWASPQ